MLDLSRLDLDEIAVALSDQTDDEHRWLIDTRTGQVVFWTSDSGIDGTKPVDLDEVDLIPIDPLPAKVCYQDMVDFAERASDDDARRRLGGPSKAGEPSAGSRTNSMRSTPIWCRRGTPCVTCEPSTEEWRDWIRGSSATRVQAAS